MENEVWKKMKQIFEHFFKLLDFLLENIVFKKCFGKKVLENV